MSSSLHIEDNFIKTVLLECINKGIKVYHCALYHTVTVLLEYTDCSLQFSRNAIYFIHFPTMLALCLMLSMTYYTQNFSGKNNWKIYKHYRFESNPGLLYKRVMEISHRL